MARYIPLIDFDYVTEQPTDLAFYALSLQQVQLLLCLSGVAHWQNYWSVAEPTTEQIDIEDSLASSTERQLLMPIPLNLRQNPDTPCILEWTTDGVTWIPFADLLMCPPLLTTNAYGGLNIGYHTTEGFTEFRVPDGGWTAEVVTDWFNDAAPTAAMLTQTNDKCTAAANVTNVLRAFCHDMGTNLINTVAANGQQGTEIEGGLLLLFGKVVASEISIGVVAFLAALQGLFAVTPFTDADFRAITCLVNTEMTGSAGSWVLDTATIRSNLGSIGLSSGLSGLLQAVMDMIGDNGMHLAAKTTAISSYNCAAVSADVFYAVLDYKFRLAANNLTFQILAPAESRLGRPSLIRIKQKNQLFLAGSVIGGDNTVALSSGYQDASPGASAMTSAISDLWMRNPAVYSTNALALAAIRTLMGDTAYTPTITAMTSSPTWPAWAETRLKYTTSVAQVLWFTADVYYYQNISYAACP